MFQSYPMLGNVFLLIPFWNPSHQIFTGWVTVAHMVRFITHHNCMAIINVVAMQETIIPMYIVLGVFWRLVMMSWCKHVRLTKSGRGLRCHVCYHWTMMYLCLVVCKSYTLLCHTFHSIMLLL